jgi:hypothetical protein
MFSDELMCLGGIDLAGLYNSTDKTSQWAIQQYLETLYISGNVFLKPHKKKQFLQAVTKIKSKYNKQLIPTIPGEMFNDQSIQGALGQLQGIFGGDSGIMGEMLGDVTGMVGNALKNHDPNQLLQDMLSGDMSKFGDVFKHMDEKYGERLQNEPFDEKQLMQNASRAMKSVGNSVLNSNSTAPDMSGLMQNMLGEEGGGIMGMMQGLMGGDNENNGAPDIMSMMQGMMGNGNNTNSDRSSAPDIMSMMQGLMGDTNSEGGPNLMSMMQGLMQSNESNEIDDVQNSPYFSPQSAPNDQSAPEEDIKDPPSDSD